MQERVKEIRREEGGTITVLESGKQIRTDAVLFAQGREPNSEGLKVANAGLDIKDGWITVDQHFQTSVPHIFAVGDLIGRPALASTGMEQGRAAVLYAFGGGKQEMAENLPMAVYTIPEISYVGKTEKEVQKENIPYIIGRAYFKHSARGQIIGDEDGLIKLLFNPDDRKLLGVHIIGSEATELIHIGQAVMIHGGKLDYFIDTVFNYPTLAETYKIAALNGLNKTSAALPVHL